MMLSQFIQDIYIAIQKRNLYLSQIHYSTIKLFYLPIQAY